MFISAIPTVLAAYIILFGDVLQSRALIAEADHLRPDERIDYNPNRAHLIFGGRNTFMSIFGPDIVMCGPLWAAMQVVVIERYKDGKAAMKLTFWRLWFVPLGHQHRFVASADCQPRRTDSGYCPIADTLDPGLC